MGVADMDKHLPQALNNERIAADYLDVPVATMRWWRHAGGGPVYVKMGNKVRYRLEDLDGFIKSSLRPGNPAALPSTRSCA